MKLEHKLAIVAGSLAAPGFAQVVAGKTRAAAVWLVVEVALTVIATLWVGVPPLAIAWRLAAGIAAIVERFDEPPRWVSRSSILVLCAGIGSFVLLRGSIDSYRIPTSSMVPTIEIGDYVMVDQLSVRWREPERGEIVFFAYPCSRDVTYVKRVIAVGGDTVEVRCNVVYVNGAALASELVSAQSTYDDFDAARGEWSKRSVSRYRERNGDHSYEVLRADARDFPQRDRVNLLPSCGQSEFYDAAPAAKHLTGTIVVTKPDANECEPQAHFVVPRGGLFVMGDNRTNANDSRVWGVVPVENVVGRAMGIWLTHPPGRDRSFGRVGGIH